MLLKFISPKKLPEANIQSEIYRFCRNNGIKVCLEYRYQHCRFDVVIINDDYDIVLYIETKSHKKAEFCESKYKTKQIAKYSAYVGRENIAICTHWNNIPITKKKILARISNPYCNLNSI